MSQKLYITITAIIFTGCCIGLIIMSRNANMTPKSKAGTLAAVKAAHPTPEKCLATSDNPKLNISTNDQNDLVQSALTGLIDIPAGTKADVHIASYTNSVATGTTVYPSKYGSFNFTLKKDPKAVKGNFISWVVTKIAPCT